MADEKDLDIIALVEGIPFEAETIREFVLNARTARQRILEKNPSQEFYLTECNGCCCSGTSYRFFAGMPRINYESGHADSGNKGIIERIYGQPEGLCADLAVFILLGIEGASPRKIDGTSIRGACYRV